MHVAPDKSKRTNDRGLKRWRIDCKLEQQSGKPGFPSRHIRKNAEGKPFTKKADAEAYMAVLNNQVENYGGVSSRDQTFGDAIDALLASFDGRAANGDGTVAHYRKLRAMIETHIPSIKIDGVPLSTIKLSYIDGDLIEDNLMSEIRDRPVGSRTRVKSGRRSNKHSAWQSAGSGSPITPQMASRVRSPIVPLARPSSVKSSRL